MVHREVSYLAQRRGELTGIQSVERKVEPKVEEKVDSWADVLAYKRVLQWVFLKAEL